MKFRSKGAEFNIKLRTDQPCVLYVKNKSFQWCGPKLKGFEWFVLHFVLSVVLGKD